MTRKDATPQQADQEAEEALNAQVGRRAPYSMVGDWVVLAPIKAQSKELYWALMAHVNTERAKKSGDRSVWPTMETLADMLGYSRKDKLRPYFKELVDLGAIEVEESERYGSGMRKRHVYTVHQAAPEDYAGHVSLQEYYAARKSRSHEGPETGSSAA